MQQQPQRNYNLDASQSVGANRMFQQAAFGQHQPQQPMPVPDSYPVNTRLGKRDEPMHSRPSGVPAASCVREQNPFDTLGIPRTSTDEMLVNEVYRKWVGSLHPDRGGDPRRFQEITRAYKMVLEVIQHTKNESFEVLKRQAERDLMANTDRAYRAGPGGTQGAVDAAAANPALAPLGHGESFNKTQFNQVFQEHRMWNPHDEGYGDHMVASEYGHRGGGKLTPEQMIMQRERDFLSQGGAHQEYEEDLLHKFNKNDFNSRFERQAQNYDDRYARLHGGGGGRANTSMVVRTEPEEMTMLRNMGARCTTLSVDKIDDFSSPFLGGGAGPSGSGGGGGYTDYMRAFSKDALITPHVADVQGHNYKSVKELEAERANLSFIPSAELLQDRARQEAALKEQDEMRWRNYLNHQEKIEAHQASIRNVLSDRRP